MNANKKKALVLGAGGFIGSHMVTKLAKEGYWVRGCDIRTPEFSESDANEFILGDLRDRSFVERVIKFHGEDCNFYDLNRFAQDEPFDVIYQFAADMGGAGFVFTEEHDSDIMHNSATINLNVLDAQQKFNAHNKVNKTKIFYSSSACMYPEYNQTDPANPDCREESAYPANPDSEYGWEKLFSERLYLAYNKNHSIPVRIARYHNIFGPLGTWRGGREKAPAAICRKISEVHDGETIECWGDGLQTRSFLYIDECVDATYRLVNSDFKGPVNIGSEEMVTINELIDITSQVAGKKVDVKHISGPVGVRGRNSNNDLIRMKLDWNYSLSLKEGIKKTYDWIFSVNPSSIDIL